MARGRSFIAVFVMSCLAVPAMGPEAHADRQTSVECGFSSDVTTNGFDGDTAVASYKVRATWCVETIYETRTITEDASSGDELSGSSDDAKVEKAKKKQKAKKGRKGKRARKRAKRKNGSGGPTTRTRTERRVVSECITDFELDAEPQTISGADLIGVTTTQAATSDACATRSYRVVGRFGRDYVRDVPSATRTVITETVAGVTLENYPLGRLGHFDVVVSFARDGGATCQGCVPSFEFCDVRVLYDEDASCVRL